MKIPALAALAACSAAITCTQALAGAAEWEIGRYLSKYPAMYVDAGISGDPRASTFAAGGSRQDGATPTYGPGTRFPLTQTDVTFEWHFPFFETEALPFISSRLWTARATLGYAKTQTHGPIKDYAEARNLAAKDDGITDIALEFGPVLWGSQDWRERKDHPLSVILLGLATLPVGARDPDAPNNIGTNKFSFGAKLGAHLRPLPRLLIDAGVAYRTYLADEEPAFGAQTPHRRGDDINLDATAALRLHGGIYAAASFNQRSGSANEYEKVRFTATTPAAGAGMETFPDPAPQHDGGTRDARLGLALHAFVLPRVQVGLHYLHPLSGRSGEFDQPYLQQQQNCTATASCNPQANGSEHVDGLGPARVYASNVWMLTVNWNLLQGDTWLGDQ